MGELKFQKRLTLLGIVNFASTPFTGPLGILGASAIFSGKLLRLSWNDQARKNYENEKKSLKQKNNSQDNSSKFINENPETAIARQLPYFTAKLLDKDYQRKEYNKSLKIGEQVVSNYLENLPSKEYCKIKSIEIYPEQESKFLGMPLGRKSLEVKVKK